MATIRAWVCAVSLAIAACDGGSESGGARDGAIADAAVDGSLADGRGPEAGPDAGPDLPPLPPASLRLLLPGKARLLGATDACSTGGPETWCAFSNERARGGDAGVATELWVINVTRAGAGETIPCDGTSPHCRRLHGDLWTGGSLGGPFFPYDDRFDGETLMFYPGGPSTKRDGIYEGPVYAWRPGWAEPRLISSDKGLFCFGVPRAAVAYCVENVTQGPPVQFDLRAGRLVDGPASLLPLLATGVRPWRGNEIAWHAEFSPDASHFAISVQEPSTEGEVLHVGATAELGSGKPLREIAYQATYWRISLDGKKIYYLQDFSGEPIPTGKLVMADFPSGANPVVLQPGVASFQLLGDPGAVDRGVAFFQDVKPGKGGTYRVIPDREQPARVVTVATDVEDALPSPDGRYALYVRPDDQGIERINLARTDGQGSCVLNPTGGDIFGIHFLERSDLVFWSAIEDLNAVDSVPEGWVARTEGCADRRKYATKADFITTVGDRLALIGHSPKNDGVYQLFHAGIAPGPLSVTMPAAIRDETDGLMVPIVDERSVRLLFQVPYGPPEMQGVYLYGPWPR